MISFGRKHCKYDMHIHFHASFLGIAFKSFIDDKDYTAQSVCKNNWLFVCLYKSLPSTCFAFLYNFLLKFLFEEARFFFKKKAVLILISYHLFIHMFVYI